MESCGLQILASPSATCSPYFNSLFFKILCILKFYVCECLPESVSLHHVVHAMPLEARRGHQTLESGVNRSELPWKCWELIPDPLEEKPVLLITELSHKHHLFILEQYSMIRIYHSLLNHLSVEGCLTCFCLEAIRNKTTMSIWCQAFMGT